MWILSLSLLLSHSLSFSPSLVLCGGVLWTVPECRRAYLGLLELLKVGSDVEGDSVEGSRQSDPAAEQDEEHDVGVGRREVHHLWRRHSTTMMVNTLGRPGGRAPLTQHREPVEISAQEFS